MKKSTDSRELVNLLIRWQKLEDTTIKHAESLCEKTSSPFVKTTMQMILHDSRKHKVVLQSIIDSVETEAPVLSPDELAALSSMLNRHMEIEASSIAVAGEALSKSKLLMTSYVLSALLEDETNHHQMIIQLTDELKRAMIPTSTGARRKTGDQPSSEVRF